MDVFVVAPDIGTHLHWSDARARLHGRGLLPWYLNLGKTSSCVQAYIVFNMVKC